MERMRRVAWAFLFYEEYTLNSSYVFTVPVDGVECCRELETFINKHSLAHLHG